MRVTSPLERPRASAAVSSNLVVPGFTARQRWALAAILSSAFLVVLDFFIVLVALPSIQRDLAASDATLQLVIAGCATANAASLVAGGRFGDVFGRRALFITGMVLFVAASVGCAMSSTAAELVALRFLQGVAGGLVQPQVLALLSSTFGAARRQRAFAAYAMTMGAAGVCGQLVGGALIEIDLGGLGWRWCFLINVPIGIFSILAGAAALDARTVAEPTGGRTVDMLGMALSAYAMTTVIWLLTLGKESGASLQNAALLFSAVVAALFFWRSQRKTEQTGGSPLLPSSLLRCNGFLLGAVAVLIFYCGIASFYLVLGLYLQATLHLSPLESGMVFGCLAAAFFIASMVGPRTQAACGRQYLVHGACVLLVGHAIQVASALLGLGLHAILGALAIEGVGIGMVMAPLVARALSFVPHHQAGVASGIVTTMQSAGNALGVALIASIYFAVQKASGQAQLPVAFIGSMCGLGAVTICAAGVLYRLCKCK